MEANARKDVHILDSNSVMEIEEKKYNSECFNFGEKTTLNETSKRLDVKREKVGDEVSTLERNVENLKNLDLISDDNSVEILFEHNEKNINEFPKKREIQNTDKNEISKRRLQNYEIASDQKPPKRIKLIYNVDKHVDKQKKSNENLCKIENRVVLGRAINYYDNTIRQFVPSNCEFEKNINKDKSGCIVNYLNMTNHTQVLGDMVEEKDCVMLDVKNSVNMDNKDFQSSTKKELKRLTPKQLDRRAGLAKKKEERELLLQERERMKKEKEEEKIRLKQEKEEEKVRLRLEKEQEKKKQREEKEKKKLAEIEMKNEVRRKKEEERRKKEEQKLEDKRKKEEQRLEDKRRKEELQRKKEEDEELLKKKITKEAEAFSSFFKKCNVKATTPMEDFTSETPNEYLFMPFTKKADMRLAPVNRNPMDCKRRLEFEEHFNSQSQRNTYLIELQSGAIKPKKSDNTWPLAEKYVIIQSDEDLDIKEEMTLPPKRFNNRRPKLLQFYENRRPPYWGTWRKKSKEIRAKKPFKKDEIFDYEIDSDDEWEEEEPGESLHGSDDEKESEDDYEVDNDFFVPHGYLSEDENPEDETFSPETQKAKLKLLSDQFDLERKEKTKLLKPVVLGCVWFNSFSDEPSSVNPSIVNLLNKRKAVLWTDNIPITVFQYENSELSEPYLSDTGTQSSKKVNFPDSAIPELINLIHGSTNSRKNLAQLFLSNWNKKVQDKSNDSEVNVALLSRWCIQKKIKQLGKWEEVSEEGQNRKKWCWNVKKEVREKYGVCDLMIANKYEEGDAGNRKDTEASKKVSPLLITKFTKILSEDEKKNQLEFKSEKKSLPCMSSPKSLSEPTHKNLKSQLKCIKKLQEFWPTTTRNYKHCSGLKMPLENNDISGVINMNSMNTKNLGICSGNKSKEQDNNSLLSGIEPLEFRKKGNNSNIFLLNPTCEKELHSDMDYEAVEAKGKGIVSMAETICKNHTDLASVKNQKSAKMTISDYIDNNEMHWNEINTEKASENLPVECCKTSQKSESVYLLTLNEGINTLAIANSNKECPSVSTLNEQIEQNEGGTCTKVKAPNENKHLTNVGHAIAIIDNTCRNICKVVAEESKTEKVEVNSEPKPKKRVPILFSAPRGCEIIKSNKILSSDSTKQSKISDRGNN